MYGGDFHIFRPPRGITVDHEDYDFHIMVRQFKLFGPMPEKFQELFQVNENNVLLASWLVDHVPQRGMESFQSRIRN